MPKEEINPAILGFIRGTEGPCQAEEDEEWARKTAKKYHIDATTVLLHAKTYGKEKTEELLKRQKRKKQ